MPRFDDNRDDNINDQGTITAPWRAPRRRRPGTR